MIKKKALSLLLAAAMVFSMNSIAFAAETTDATVDTQVVYKDPAEVPQSGNESNSANAKAASGNAKVQNDLEKQGIYVEYVEAVAATGKKIKSSSITGTKKTGYTLNVSANGYRTSVKAVKIKSKAKNAGETITYSIKKLNGAKFVTKYNPTTGKFDSLTKKDAKEGYKAIKSVLSTLKSAEFSAVICPTRLYGAVSSNYVKALGKTVSSASLEDIKDQIIVTKKNGQVKKVQVVDPKMIKTTSNKYGLSKEGAYYKLKFKTLKKNKDYTLSENTVVLDKSNVYYVMQDDLKYFNTKDFQ